MTESRAPGSSVGACKTFVVWSSGNAPIVSRSTYACSTDRFPRCGYTDLRTQLRRAAESIATNIVEGCGAASRPEFARYLDISIKSASEAEYQLQFAHDIGVLSYDMWARLSKEVVEIRKMPVVLRRRVLASVD